MARRQPAAAVSPPPTRKLLTLLTKAYPEAHCALEHTSPFQLLVATILSAQCTDARVNMVTPALFRRYPGPKELSEARVKDVEALIRSTGFYHAKATNLIAMAKALMQRHQGEIPTSLDALVELPGVGRKTANVLLGTAFGIASGVVVDTHVARISRLLGLTVATQPERIEQDLMRLLPRKEWVAFSHRLIHHGRQVCVARRPRCRDCPLLAVCPRVGLSPLDPGAGR